MAPYEFEVKGHLHGRWSGWFDGLNITNSENGVVVLSGEIVDQATLHGVLYKVRSLNLPLIAVARSIRARKNALPGQRSTDQDALENTTKYKGVNDNYTETIGWTVSAWISAAGRR